MKKAAIIATSVTTVVLIIIILVWKYYPSSTTEIIEPGGEVIEANAIVSLFSGSSLLKGSSGTFLILGMLALAVYYIRRKKNSRANTAATATVTTPPSLHPSRNMPMAYLPSAPPPLPSTPHT